jgi:hypothetical protein
MIYWKIKFDDADRDMGWLEFNDDMIETGIYELDGKLITSDSTINYHPIEQNARPDWGR